MKYKFLFILLILLFGCTEFNNDLIGEWVGDDNNLIISDKTFSFHYDNESNSITQIKGSVKSKGPNKIEFNYLEYQIDDSWFDFENLSGEKSNKEIIIYEFFSDNELKITNSNNNEYLYIKSSN